MNPSSPVSITCEFESIDHADMAFLHLLRTAEDTETVRIQRCIPSKHVSGTKQKMPFPYMFFPDAAFLPTFWFDRHPDQTIEPHRIRSVTTRICCRQNHAHEIAAKLVSLGASHIRIR